MATCRNGVILWTLIHTLTGQWWALHWCSSLQLTDIRVKPTGELPGYHHCVHGHCLYHIYKGQPFYLMQTKTLEPHHNILSICLVCDCMWMSVCMKVRDLSNLYLIITQHIKSFKLFISDWMLWVFTLSCSMKWWKVLLR